jgi:aryl-alcohol dehydrogenase-like predicted oxidoreductase
MKYTQLGHTSLRVSAICYGTWQFGGDWGSFEANEPQAAIRQALDLGITFFDTAQAYGFGASERVLGQALQAELKAKRDTVVIATKGGLRKEGDTLLRDASAKWIRQGVEQSLRNLGVDHLDLYQVHWPDPRTPFDETARALDQLVQAGKVRYVGVSNFDVAQMREFGRRGGLTRCSRRITCSAETSNGTSCRTAESTESGPWSTDRSPTDCSAGATRRRRRFPAMIGGARAPPSGELDSSETSASSIG